MNKILLSKKIKFFTSNYLTNFEKAYSILNDTNIGYLLEQNFNIKVSFFNYLKLKKITSYLIKRKDYTFLLNFKKFYNVKILIKKGVFVPQYDTEKLVDHVLKEKNNFKKGIEIGIGTGAISIAISNNSNIFMDGIDISQKAINLAKKNILLNNLKEKNHFFKKNIFKLTIQKKYDFIVSNPPYISKKDPLVTKWVKKHQPKKALYAEKNGMLFYDYIIKNCKKLLKNNGHIFFEIDYQKKENLLKLIKANKSIIKDYLFDRDFNNKIRYLILIIEY